MEGIKGSNSHILLLGRLVQGTRLYCSSHTLQIFCCLTLLVWGSSWAPVPARSPLWASLTPRPGECFAPWQRTPITFTSLHLTLMWVPVNGCRLQLLLSPTSCPSFLFTCQTWLQVEALDIEVTVTCGLVNQLPRLYKVKCLQEILYYFYYSQWFCFFDQTPIHENFTSSFCS